MTPLFDAHGRPLEPSPASTEAQPTGPNKLADSTSPYLLQHAMNPVDWHPWGPEALEKSRRLDRPILLSIGYAACHWCHVMEHESFEDTEIAALMNESFVNIKVDREERPDLDDIYMSAVQLLTGSGGWPLNVFLTPDLKPFYGGTYFPPDDRYGRPGMKRLIPEVARIYRERRGDVTEQAEELSRAVRALVGGTGTEESSDRGDVPGGELLDRAAGRLIQTADTEWGGFGHAPKFPPSMGLSLLLRYNQRKPDNHVREIVTKTLDRMAMGGMYDHVGGGFARYSTDERWLVPHFEKMLYDNALLVPVYADALRELGEGEAGLYRRTIEDTLAFVERELTDPAGGFYSSLDADSEGEEGRFYVWSAPEVEEVLGAEDAAFFGQVYDVSAEGNWEEKNIPWLRRPLFRLAREAGLTGADDEKIALAAEERLRPMREKLLARRAKRVRPGLDDKVLAGWNGLMISAFARAAQALDRPEAAGPADRSADFLLGTLLRDGRLLRTWRRGHAHLNGYLEDYAFLAVGLVDLYETTFDRRRLDAAEALVETALRHFGDGAGGFYFTSDDHEALLTRPRGIYDGATPSGTSMMVQALLRLSLLLDRPEWRTAAEGAIAGVAGSLKQAPGGHQQMIAAVDWLLDPPVEIAIVAPRSSPAARDLLRVVQGRYLPNRILAWLDPTDSDRDHAAKRIPLLRGKTMRDGAPTVYVCRNYACREPVTTIGDLTRVLAETTSRKS